MVAQRKKESDNILYIGVDLGTSRSAVSASNGVREWERSLVGWPKDIIAKKFLKRDIVFGEACLKHRLALDVFRPLAAGVIKTGTDRDEEAARTLVKHLISMAKPEPGQSVYAVVGAPAEASTFNKQLIREAVSDVADACLIVSEPFTIAYGLEMLFNTLVVDIGAGTIDLCIMHGTVPAAEDQKTLVQAGDFIDQQLFEMLTERYPSAQFTETMVQRWKEEHAFVRVDGSPQDKIIVSIPVGGRPTSHDITDELSRACSAILPFLREELRTLIASFDPEFQVEVRQNVVLAGGGSQIRGLRQWLEADLADLGGGHVSTVEDPLYAGADGALAIARDTPADDWDRLRTL
ncbi:MAG: rod shape-determining protein [Candidatus Schekmanbacteria bacterium]|nr:rod shape-determining protein [Candidatus Schekmanbacteria bacterium]